MYIDPENREFSDIVEIGIDTTEEEFKKANEKFQEARNSGKVTSSSIDTEQLRKLQDDLRKAGYRKVK